MKLLCLLLAASLVLPLAGRAQLRSAPVADSATFVLHKFAQPIGRETYQLTHTRAGLRYDVRFRFVDCSSPVALRAR